MPKTTELREEVEKLLNTLPGITYHRNAYPNASFPYKVYSLRSIDGRDMERFDYALTVDTWDRSVNSDRAEGIADGLDELLHEHAIITDGILATIYRDISYPIDDNDKQLQHIQSHFVVQLYIRR